MFPEKEKALILFGTGMNKGKRLEKGLLPAVGRK